MELYVSRLSDVAKEKDLFYCKPKVKFEKEDPCWYFDIPVGHIILSRKLSDMFTHAGLDCDGVHNHSLRANGISRMYNSGIAEKLIMERSGHLSVGGVRQYERTSDQQRVKVSEVISKPTTVVASEQSQTISQMIASHTHADKENVFDIKDLHGCTINISLTSSEWMEVFFSWFGIVI